MRTQRGEHGAPSAAECRHRRDVSPLTVLAAAANVIAAALFVAMALVQLSIRDVADPMPNELEAVHWVLDVAWDLYLGIGTIGFGLASFRVPWLGWPFAVPGLAIAAALLVFNVATFPEPPASAGLVDVGPFVGLWYAAVTVRIALLWRAESATTR